MPDAFEAIGTRWQIDFFEAVSSEAEERIMKRVRDRIEQFDRAYSRFREDSLVTQMSHEAGIYELPQDSKILLDLYAHLSKLTGGAFTPLIARTLEDAGYDAQYSLQPKSVLRTPLLWNDTMEFRSPFLEMKQPAMLDFGAAGKGYLIDLVADVLMEERITNFCVDAGGDMIQRSSVQEKMSVGLEDPGHVGQVIGVAQICNQSLCGSAGNRRTWGNYHHTIDPRTLTSPSHILAIWTIAPTTIIADALATCLYLVSPEILKTHFDFEYVILFPDYSVVTSPGFPVTLFTSLSS